MSRDKQIEEMANYCCYPCDLYDEGNEGKDCTYCDYKTCLCAEAAKALYNAGYRKASEVARAIFEEIEKRIADLEYRANTPRKTVKVEELKAQVDWILHEVVPSTIAELKRKYMEKTK